MGGNGQPCSVCGRGGDSGLKHKPEGCKTGLTFTLLPDGRWQREIRTDLKGK